MRSPYGSDGLDGGDHAGPWPALADLLAATTLVFFVMFAVSVIPGIQARIRLGRIDSTINGLQNSLKGSQFAVQKIGDYLRITIGGDAVFERDRSDLGSMKISGRVGLEALAQKLRDAAVLGQIDQIHVVGHTSAEGGDEHNWRLSSERAVTIALYLIGPRGGLPACKVTALGRGRYYPVDPELARRTAVPAAQDRRIEVEIRPLVVNARDQQLRSNDCVEHVASTRAP